MLFTSLFSKFVLTASIASSLALAIPSTTTYVRPVEIVDAPPIQSMASKIADAIYEDEGRCDHLHGESGEYGCFQYLPSTWAAYSNDIAGSVLKQTGVNERYITEGMIQKWLDDGKDARWIFLEWNQGNGDGWGGGTDCYAGTNKWGVHYDSCAYAAKGLALLRQ